MLRRILRQQLGEYHHRHVQQRSLFGWLMYSAKKGIDRDFIAQVQQPIDLSPEAIRNWATRKQFEALKDDHKFVPERLEILGPDLAAAHFIVKRGGAVKFVNSERWIEKDKEGKYRLPDRRAPTFMLEAVDASNTNMMYTSFDNFVGLRHIQYLNLSHCKYIDDWCIDKLQAFKRTLVYLDVSGCPNVTERGLAALHKLQLRCLRAHNMDHIEERGLLKLMLEEVMPACRIEGLESQGKDTLPPTVPGLESKAAETQ